MFYSCMYVFFFLLFFTVYLSQFDVTSYFLLLLTFLNPDCIRLSKISTHSAGL